MGIGTGKETRGEALRFVVVGGAATVLHYVVYVVLSLCMPPNPAYVIGYALSFVGNFYATSYFTFRTMPTFRRLVGMAAAHGINFLLHIALLNLFLWLGVAAWLVPVPVYAVAIPVNFLLVKQAFKKR